MYPASPLAQYGGSYPAPGNPQGVYTAPQGARRDQPGPWASSYPPFSQSFSQSFSNLGAYPARPQAMAASSFSSPAFPNTFYPTIPQVSPVIPSQPGRLQQPSTQPSDPPKVTGPGHINLAVWQMIKIAAAVFTMRVGFHLAPKGLEMLLKSSEKRLLVETDNLLLKFFVERVQGVSKFLTTRSQEHGSSLYKSLMAIVDGLMMLYVGGEVDRYFLKKNDNFKPKEVKDPEKVVDKVLLVLIATERMENLMHHFFHWLDPKPTSGRMFMYGELAALSAVLMDTIVKISSDRYRIKKNGNNNQPASPASGGPTSRLA